MQVILNILTWNDRRYLPDLFVSLDQQTYNEFTVRVLDNGSSDGALEYLKQHHPQCLVARNVRNQGFAGGHNQLIRFALERWQGEDLADKAIVVANADTILDDRLVEELVVALEADPGLGAVQPKILRAFANVTTDDGLEQDVRSDVIDTTGLTLGKNWRLEDRGRGIIDKGQYDDQTDVIGPAGVLAMYRASALAEVMIDGEVFDDDFFAYREDGDLALRLRKAGWRTRFVPSAKAHHYRGTHHADKRSKWQRFRDYRQQRPFALALNTRNQLLLLLKHLTLFDALRYGPFIALSEFPRQIYGLFFEPQTRRALLATPFLLLKTLRKRKQVFALVKESPAIIRSYIGV